MQEEQNPSTNGGSAPAGQPGQVIAPGASVAPAQPVMPDASPPPPQQAAAQPEPIYGAATPQPVTQDSGDSITWTASEFITHEKSAGWYGGLGGVAVVLAVLIYLFTKDLISPIVVIVSAILFGVYGARKPRQVQFSLGPDLISVGDKHYGYGEFRNFAILDEGAFSSIVFRPLKRFAPLLSIYYAPEDEDQIVAMLADRLPMDEHKPDAMDRLMRSIRF